jgi:hypothetical protein
LQRPAGIKNTSVSQEIPDKEEKKLHVVVVVCRGQLEALGARVLLHEAKELPCVLTAQLIRYSLTSQWSGAELETRKQRSSLFSICREKHS